MTKVRFLLLLLAFGILSNCSWRNEPPSSWEIRDAVSNAQKEIDNPRAVMPTWYRHRLVATYSSVKGEYTSHKFNPFKKDVQDYDAKSVVSLRFFWVSLFLSFVPASLFYGLLSTTFSDHRRLHDMRLTIVNAALFHFIGILITAVAATILIIGFYPAERFIPWHFAGFTGLFSSPIVFLLLFLIRRNQRSVGLALTKMKEAKENKKIQLTLADESFSARYATITEYIELLSDDSDSNRAIASDIRKEAIEIKFLGRSKPEKIENARRLKLALNALRNHGLEKTMAAEVLSDLISPFEKSI